MAEKRTTFYVVIILVLALMLGSAVFLLWLLFYTPKEDALPPGQEQMETETPEPEELELPKPPDREEYKPPEPLPEDAEEAGPNLEEHLYGTLRLSYDKNALVSETESPKTRVTLLAKEGEALPRLDAQVLDGTGLGDSEQIRLAVGLLQAYYTDPPETEAVTVGPDPDMESGYVLEAPAVGETPAMTARVRFLPTGAKLWYLVLLCPKETAPGDALAAAYEGAAIA